MSSARPPNLYERLVTMLYDLHPYDRHYSRWIISQPMANYIADWAGVPRGPVNGAHLLGRPVRLGNDVGGIRLELIDRAVGILPDDPQNRGGDAAGRDPSGGA